MSLFPAYAKDNPSTSYATEKNEAEWLKNSSFIGFKTSEGESDCSSSTGESELDNENEDVPSAKRPLSPCPVNNKKHKNELTSSEVDLELQLGLDKLCFIDVTPSAVVIKPGHPKSHKKRKAKNKKINRQGRYFSGFKRETDDSELFLLDENELRKRTEDFNVSLRDDPSNIDLWIKYIRFQDSVIKEVKARAEKKLAILEKAIEQNQGCPELYEEKFLVMESIYSIDQLSGEAKKLIGKDTKNLVAWKWLIDISLFNVTKLSAPKTVETFTSALEALFRTFPNNSEPLLDVLLKCCLFLRQAGLWEQLWMLVRLSLELNLSTPGSNAFSLAINIPEQKIKEMEDTIITCGLPLGSLWLRLEYLRECTHFLPVADSTDDPQRVVFPCDVSDLLHPVHATFTPRLIAVLLTALKVPMIPSTHCSALYIGLNKLPWAIESPEFILVAVSHPYLINQVNTNCLNVAKELLVSPQYLVEERLGCVEFFESVSTTFEKVVRLTSGDTQVATLVWLVRWWRFLGRKPLLSRAKKLLKEHRDCIPLYTEFALFSYSLGDTATCLKVLDTAVSLSKSPLNLANKAHKIHLAYLYKTYIDILFKMGSKLNRDKILMLILSVGLSQQTEVLDESVIAAGIDRFSHVTKEVIADCCGCAEEEMTLQDVLLPQFAVSWLACHASLLSLTSSPWKAVELLQSAIDQLQPIVLVNTATLGASILEGWYEIMINIMHSSCSPSFPDCYTVLRKMLRTASEHFPNNLYILHIASVIDIIVGKWWSVSPVFLNNSVFMKLFTIFVYREKMLLYEGKISEDERLSSERRLYGLVKKVVNGSSDEERNIQRCPLIWRLLLQFVATQHPSEIKSTFYKAVDMCPWVKSVYYDAAKVLPEELGQIQDLLIEKELRIHITSEELEILRQDTANPSSRK